MEPYIEDRFLFPPRAGSKQKIMKTTLPMLERQGWWAEFKKNGTHNVIHVSPEKTLRCTRRNLKENNGRHMLWQPTLASSRLIQRVPGNGWSVFDGELLHSKGNGIKDTNYLYDILVYNGTILYGTTYEERYQLLLDIFLPMAKRNPDQVNSHYIIDDHLWLAKVHRSGFAKLFADLETAWAMGEKGEDEGLVLKNPNGRLASCSREGLNGGWQMKCRRPHENYNF